MEYRMPDTKPALMKLLAIRPGYQKTISKSLVMSAAKGIVWLFCDLLPAGCIASSICTAARMVAGKILLVALLCLGTMPANAGEQPPLAWACWISEQVPISIKCIHDRSRLRQGTLDDPEAALRSLSPDTPDDQEAALRSLSPDTPDDPEDKLDQPPQADRNQPHQAVPSDPEDEVEAEVLDQIYSKILAGDTARLDDFVEEHNDDLSKGSVWVIKIYSFPMDSSWLENRPARVVKSALCRGSRSCSVILHEPGR